MELKNRILTISGWEDNGIYNYTGTDSISGKSTSLEFEVNCPLIFEKGMTLTETMYEWVYECANNSNLAGVKIKSPITGDILSVSHLSAGEDLMSADASEPGTVWEASGENGGEIAIFQQPL